MAECAPVTMLDGAARSECQGTQPHAMDRLLFMEAVLNTLAGDRFSKKQIITRVVALLFARKHFLFAGLSLREVAERYRVSHSALSRAHGKIVPAVAAMVEAARIAFDCRFTKTPRAHSEKPERKRRTAAKV